MFNFTPDVFFEKFFSDKAEFSFLDFFTLQGHSNITFTEWKDIEEVPDPNKIEPSQSMDSIKANKVRVREANMVVKVKGVPFLSETRVIKVQKCYKEG